jgi:hypothetical protein
MIKLLIYIGSVTAFYVIQKLLIKSDIRKRLVLTSGFALGMLFGLYVDQG